MGTINVYENPSVSGRGVGFDNSPGSNNEELPAFTTKLDTRDYRGVGLVTIEWVDDGLTYSATNSYIWLDNQLTWAAQTISVNGAVNDTAESINAPVNTLLLYSGDAQLNWLYSLADTINGASADDIIYGYGGRDILRGYGGDDVLNGGLGSDYLYGGDGDDILSDLIPTKSLPSDGYYYGGNGMDTLRLNASSSEIMLSRNPETEVVTIYSKTGWESYAYPDIEYIELDDERIDTSTISFKGQSSFVPYSTTTPAWYSSYNGSPKIQPVYEFYNARSNAFFYTSDENEKNTIIANSVKVSGSTISIKEPIDSVTPGYVDRFISFSSGEWPYFYQGSSFNAASVFSGIWKPIHRFYNVDTGHHLWSIDPKEIELIKSKWDSGEWSYKYEGTSFYVYDRPWRQDGKETVEVLRLYNSQEGRHFYTADLEEVELMKLTGVWVLEGVAFYGE